MSSIILFNDNASSLLASAIGTGDTSLTVTPGEGQLFSNPGAGQVAYGTLEDVNGNIEIVQITSRTVDAFVIVRGQDNTTPLPFASGTRFEQRLTAGMLQALLQKNGGDTLSGTTNVTGVLQLGAGGSIQGGEYAGGYVRSQPGDTSNQIHVPIGSAATAAGSPILTTANLLNNLPSGVGVALTGMIVIWSGASSSVPAGWVICDGNNGTPDLRDQFVLGAGGALPTAGGSSSTTTGSTSLGSLSVGNTALTIDQIPSHSHRWWSSGLTYSSNGQPAVLGIQNGAGSYHTNLSELGGGQSAVDFIETTGGSGGPGSNTAANPHSHSLSGTTAHAHSYTLPPYRALFYIMKT
ncbi:MAG TPA: hypothetical protein VN734_17100 [Acidobacteriaceae bacterium]|nr:hypothetical protein [Acidobacteriaceae bacterium]